MLCVEDRQQALEIVQLMPLLLGGGKYSAHILGSPFSAMAQILSHQEATGFPPEVLSPHSM